MNTGLQEFSTPCTNVSAPWPPAFQQWISSGPTFIAPVQLKVSLKETTPSSTSNKVLNVILLILILALIAVIAVTIYWLQQAGGF